MKKIFAVVISISLLSLNPLTASANDLDTIRQKAISNNTYFIENTYCHAKDANAELQAYIGNQWLGIKSALGWDLDPLCPATTPATPWTRAVVPEGTQLRWRVWFVGAFDWTSEVFIAPKNSAPADEPFDTDMKSVEKTTTNISKTIKCIKGKKIKKITAETPKCPKGYKEVKKR
jgi:hypothetical protein